MTLDRESLAWAGGLFEGEGCFSFWKSKDRGEKVYLHTSISSTDEDVVRRFHGIVKVGTVRGPFSNGSNKSHWIWRVGSFEDNQFIVALLWPWLCSRRRAKAIESLKAWLSCGRRYCAPKKR